MAGDAAGKKPVLQWWKSPIGEGRSAWQPGGLSHVSLAYVTDIVYTMCMPHPARFTAKYLLRLTPEMAASLEDYRFAQRFPTRLDAIRHLIETGIKASVERSGEVAKAPASR